MELRNSILIIVDPDGSYAVSFPEDEDIDFSLDAANKALNATLAIDNPSIPLRIMLYLEGRMRHLSKFLFGSV